MVETPESTRRQLKTAVMIACNFLMVSIIGYGAWIFYSSISVYAEQTAQEARNAIASNIVTHVQNNFSAYSEPLIDLAKSRETIQLFQQGDDDALLVAVEKNQVLFKNVLKLRYIKPGDYELDDVSVPPLGYASLDMLKKAELTSKINAEVHLFGNVNQHIVLIRRVNNSAFALIGLLHLSLSTDLLNDLFNGLDIGDGYAELIQRGTNENLILTGFGNQFARHGRPIVVGINDTRWSIKYWPAAIDAIAIKKILMIALLLIIPVLLIIALLAKGGSLITRLDGGQESSVIEDPSMIYKDAACTVATGAHAGVEKQAPNLSGDKRIIVNSKLLSQGLTVDDATRAAVSAQFAKQASPGGTLFLANSGESEVKHNCIL